MVNPVQPPDPGRTAAERLEAIEMWSRRTFATTVVAATFLGVVAASQAMWAYDYLRVKRAVQEAVREAKEEAQRRSIERDPRSQAPAGPPPGSGDRPDRTVLGILALAFSVSCFVFIYGLLYRLSPKKRP